MESTSKVGVSVDVYSLFIYVLFHLSYFHQVPDFLNARINGLPVKEVIKDTKWLEEDFTEIVQKVRSHIMVNDFVFSVLDGVISDYLW